MSKIRAVLFDMDGLIIDSELYWSKIEKKFFQKYGLHLTPVFRRQIMALSEEELVNLLIKKYQLKKTTLELLKERRIMAQPIYDQKAKLLPGFLNLIKQIQKHGLKTALVSSSPYCWINPVLQRFNLKKFFDVIVSADDMPAHQGKPHPAIYLFSAKKLNLPPAKCLVFEDSINGIKAAKAAMMYCVAVPDRRWIKDRSGVGKADLVAKSLNDKRIYQFLNWN